MAKQANGLILLAMALGLLMASLDNTITSAAISNIIKDIGGFEKMSWVFTAYMLASTSTMLIFGKMSDMFGRKLFYLIGIAFFLAGSALCGTAHSIDQLIAYRVIQGIGSGALFPISFSIIFTMFSDPKMAAKLSGVFAAIFGVSSVLGPQIGTFLSENWGWRWCFYVNLPIGILSFLTLLVALKETRSANRPKIDYLGTLFLVVSTVSFMLALEWGGKDYAWGSWQIVGLFALAVVVAALFIWTERRAAEPVLPLHLFKNRMVLGTSAAVFCQGAIMFAAITYLPIFAVGVLGSANSNGLLTPMMLSVMIGAVSFGFLQTFFAFRPLMLFSMTAGVVVCYLLTLVSHDASKLYMTFLMVLLGLGAIGPLMSVSQNAVAASVDKRYLGISSSIVGFWRSIGGVFGASLMATMVNNNVKDLITEGAPKLNIPADKVADVANPELLVRGGQSLPQPIHDFLRDAVGTAINHGFILGIVFAAIGIAAALYSGPGRYERPQQAKTEQQVA